MKDTVVIFGSYDDGSLEVFNWSRRDCDLWLFNEAAGSPRAWAKWCTAVFQMHLPAIFRNPKNRNDASHYQWLQANDAIPVYMQAHYDEIPMSIKYPLEEVIASLLPRFERPANATWPDQGGYFTSTLCYMLALAIHQGYKRIELWGIGLSVNTEYMYQRPGALFWMGIAVGRGLELYVHSHLFDAPLYGYQGDLHIPLDKFLQRESETRARYNASKEQFDAATARVRAAAKDYLNTRIVSKQFAAAVQDHGQALRDCSQATGRHHENERYITKARAMLQAGDDFRFARQEFEDTRHAYNTKIAQLIQDRAATQLEVERCWQAIPQAHGTARRARAIDALMRAIDRDNELVAQLNALDGRADENTRYMRMLDEQYRAAGGSRAVEMMEAVKE